MDSRNILLGIILFLITIFIRYQPKPGSYQLQEIKPHKKNTSNTEKIETFIHNRIPHKRSRRKLRVFKDSTEITPTPLTRVADLYCIPQSKSTEEFHDSFFSFRDQLHENTSIRPDPVDKLNNLRVLSHLDTTEKLQGVRIGDISDHITSYTRP